jgi:enoyl-CoA hydratase
MAITSTLKDGIAEIVMSHPPVNALTVGDTWKIRDAFIEAGNDPSVRVVILTAEGKGFNAGIDIKEMQSVDGFEHLLGSGEACYETFKTIYETPVPVIAAVNDFCMGLGVGLAGSADIIIASNKARFGLPEVDNGALGCSSHLARLVPPLKLRQMTFTCIPVTAQELFEYGTVFKVTEPDELRAEARVLAEHIAKKPAAAIRFAKAALNHIDPHDLHTNYRLEQGYTYQLNIMGIGDQQRDAFIDKSRDVTR